jgi:predicted nucleotide-binding protein
MTARRATSGRAQALRKDRRQVFVIYGRNEKVRSSLFRFLRALNLRPIEWSEAIIEADNGSPYIGDVLERQFAAAGAFLVLLTPDDLVRLRPSLATELEDGEQEWRAQPRANVLFEAGLAFGHDPSRTILVEVGRAKGFSDIAGRHVVRLTNSAKERQQLADRLKKAGCLVNLRGTDWQTEGDFTCDTPVEDPVKEHVEVLRGELTSLETRVKAAVNDAKKARTYIVHIEEFISELRAAWEVESPSDSIRRFERMRQFVFTAIVEGAKTEPGERVWGVFFTPYNSGRRRLLRAEHHSGHTPLIEDHPLVRSEKSIAGTAYVTRDIVYSARAQDDDRFQRLGVPDLDEIGSIICVPAYALGASRKDEPLGVLSVSSSLSEKLDKADRRFASICADVFALIEDLVERRRGGATGSRASRQSPQTARNARDQGADRA